MLCQDSSHFRPQAQDNPVLLGGYMKAWLKQLVFEKRFDAISGAVLCAGCCALAMGHWVVWIVAVFIGLPLCDMLRSWALKEE
jgi:hypothetical protein